MEAKDPEFLVPPSSVSDDERFSRVGIQPTDLHQKPANKASLVDKTLEHRIMISMAPTTGDQWPQGPAGHQGKDLEDQRK